MMSYFNMIGVMRRPAWSYCSSVYLPKKHCAIYRDDDLGVQMQVEIRRDWSFFPPTERQYFFIDGVKKIYRSEEKMVRALQKSRFEHTRSLRQSNGLMSSIADPRGWKALLTKG